VGGKKRWKTFPNKDLGSARCSKSGKRKNTTVWDSYGERWAGMQGDLQGCLRSWRSSALSRVGGGEGAGETPRRIPCCCRGDIGNKGAAIRKRGCAAFLLSERADGGKSGERVIRWRQGEQKNLVPGGQHWSGS